MRTFILLAIGVSSIAFMQRPLKIRVNSCAVSVSTQTVYVIPNPGLMRSGRPSGGAQ